MPTSRDQTKRPDPGMDQVFSSTPERPIAKRLQRGQRGERVAHKPGEAKQKDLAEIGQVSVYAREDSNLRPPEPESGALSS